MLKYYITNLYNIIYMSVFNKVYVKTSLRCAQLSLDENTISNINTDGNISIIPNGTGEVLLKANPSSDLGASTKQYTDTKATINDSSSSSTTETWSIDKIKTETPYDLVLACSDETTSIATNMGQVVSVRAPRGFTLNKIKVSVATTGGNGFSIIVKKDGIIIKYANQDANLVKDYINTVSFSEDDIITIEIDDIGAGTATGLKVYLIGHI
jgi:hypothetical protein